MSASAAKLGVVNPEAQNPLLPAEQIEMSPPPAQIREESPQPVAVATAANTVAVSIMQAPAPNPAPPLANRAELAPSQSCPSRFCGSLSGSRIGSLSLLVAAGAFSGGAVMTGSVLMYSIAAGCAGMSLLLEVMNPDSWCACD